MARPRKSPLPPDPAPAPAESPASTLPAEEENLAPPTRLYWIGALPQPGKFKIRVPAAKRTGYFNDNVEYSELLEITALDMWTRHSPSQWGGKCRYFQNIPVRGCDFPAWSDRLVRDQAGEGNGQIRIMLEPYPGRVVKWTQEELAGVIHHARKTLLRERNGKGKQNNSMTVTIVNTETEAPRTGGNPLDIMERNWDTDAARRVQFNRATDTWLAEFLYIVPLDQDPETDPEDYFRLVPQMEELLANPPKPLSETWKDLTAKA